MRIRFGYVAMALDLKNCSPSKTITYKSYNKIKDDEVKLYKLKKITKQNLINTKRILLYNVATDIKVYRLSSKLVPLVTHPDVINWDYQESFKEIYGQISNIIKDNNLRISMHPDHFTLISSPRYDVVESSIKILSYHNNIMSSMGVESASGKLVLHIGGKYKSKEKTKDRFIKNFKLLDRDIKERIILENDDKTYDIFDVLEICEELNIPMVLDVHHQWCNNRNENLINYIDRIFKTWENHKLKPKIHISSPKTEKKFRAHNDYIDSDSFISFSQEIKSINKDFDVMIEAKKKNLALFKLMNDIKVKNKFKIIDKASLKV